MKPLAMMSPFDKTGLIPFARSLISLGWEIVATSGTYKELSHAKISCFPVSNLTDLPEMMDGLLKTLHHAVYGGIIMDRNNPEHIRMAAEYHFRPIDMVVCNLFDNGELPAREEYDVGGSNMLRAAALNHKYVLPIVDPKDYTWIIMGIKAGSIRPKDKLLLAKKALRAVQKYDCLIAQRLG